MDASWWERAGSERSGILKVLDQPSGVGEESKKSSQLQKSEPKKTYRPGERLKLQALRFEQAQRTRRRRDYEAAIERALADLNEAGLT